MSLEPVTPQRLLELVYGLLPEDEAAELRGAIAADEQWAAAYARAQATAELLGRAARLSAPPIALRRPETVVAVPFVRATLTPEPARSRPLPLRVGPEVHRPWARWAGWTVGISAALLLLLALGGYTYHRGQLGDIAAGPVRVQLLGPPWLEAGHAPRFSLLTTSLAGEPVSAQIELGFWSPDGRHLGGHKEQTDQQGRLEVTLPADSRVFQVPEVRLALQVFRDKPRAAPPLEAHLAVRHPRTAIHLALERTTFRPGETVRFRVLAVEAFRLSASPIGRLRWKVLDPSGAVLDGSRQEVALSQGLGWAEYRLPPGALAGRYTVAASCEGMAVEARRTFLVQTGPPAASPESSAAAKLRVAFFPEGGQLVAGLENRVYLSVQDARDQPVRIAGRIVDRQNRPVALADTGDHGLGAFSLEPVAGESYRLQIETPQGIEETFSLPTAVADSGIVLSTGRSVFGAGEPLEFVVRCKEGGVPLVAAAWCRGVLVGQQALVTQTQASAGPTQANPVILPLDELAAGVVRLCIFDYRHSPPREVAQRLVFRRPGRYLHVSAGLVEAAAAMARRPHALNAAALPVGPKLPQSAWRLRLGVTDEQGKAAPAVLGAWLLESGPTQAPADADECLLASVLLGNELLEAGALRHLGPMPFEWRQPEKTLDLVLGTCGVLSAARSAAEDRSLQAQAGPQPGGGANASAGSTESGPAPCTLLDNLAQLKTEYQDRLESYRKHRTRVLNMVITLIFFGGIGLVLFVSMANLLNIPCGLRLWVPTLVTAAICLAVGLELLHPERHVGPAEGVAFAPYQHPLNDNWRKEAGSNLPGNEAGRKESGRTQTSREAARNEVGHEPPSNQPPRDAPGRDDTAREMAGHQEREKPGGQAPGKPEFRL